MQSERDVQHSDTNEIDAAIARLIPPKVFDETGAKTVEEVAKVCGMKTQAVQEKLTAAVAAGTWEQVYKHTPHGRVARAYRPKK